ncbi:MAG: T9SS type A sorting domain-containing protein [Flavobacteriales bacterium]|nr:T9SS type A sorting domain-containing protein [Flavobacteriales bacterium]
MRSIFTLAFIAFAGVSIGQNYGEWTFDADAEGWTSSGDGVLFEWTDEGPQPTASIWGVPDMNTSTGWMLLDDDYLGNGFSTNSYLTSPVLDLSDAPAQLRLEFDQYFQEFETGMDTTQVQVSSDGGTTWHTTTINDGVGRTSRPNPEHIYINITDAVAGDPSNVQIRFRYRADWSYGWQIDNVTIVELPDYDLEVFDAYTDNIVTEYEYRQVPQGQTQDLEVGMIIRNFGAEQLTNIVGTVEILDPNGDPLTLDVSTGSLDSLNSFAIDTIWIATGVTLNVFGEHDFNFSAEADQPDDAIAVGNETALRNVEVTEGIYSHVVESELNYAASGREINGVWNEFMMGNVFEIVEDTDILSVELKIAEGTTVGQEIDVWVHEWVGTDDNGFQTVNELTAFNWSYQITQADIDNDEYITLVINEEIVLEAGKTYFAGIHGFGGDEVVWVQCEFGDGDFSTVMHGDFFQDTEDFYFGWAYQPSVRIRTGDWVISVEEYNDLTFGLGQNMPNPTRDMTVIPYELFVPGKVSLRILDLSGRTVDELINSNQAAGQHTVRYDMKDLPAGVYFYELTVDGKRMVKRMEKAE